MILLININWFMEYSSLMTSRQKEFWNIQQNRNGILRMLLLLLIVIVRRLFQFMEPFSESHAMLWLFMFDSFKMLFLKWNYMYEWNFYVFKYAACLIDVLQYFDRFQWNKYSIRKCFWLFSVVFLVRLLFFFYVSF